MKKIILLLIAIFSIESYGQEKPILVFNLITGTMDSIPIVDYDNTKLSDHTNYYIGGFNSNTEIMEGTFPVSNIYPNSNFTLKKQASTDFNLTKYPIRTSVKIFSVENDSLSSLCSGSLISKRHVLTAAHCVSPFNSNIISQHTLKVCPVFDNGESNGQFNSSFVSKIYFFKDWNFSGNDFAILELEELIGELTGWLSIGYNKIDIEISDGIFYKFTYPSTTILSIDPNEYNGDLLYYNYGAADNFTNTSIGINNASGIPGESGSSLIKIVNGQEYISYGVLSLSNNLNHSRMSNWQFYAVKNIINNDLTPENCGETFIIYPNPVIDKFFIKTKKIISEMILFDSLGKLIFIINEVNIDSGIDISTLSNGIYYLKLVSQKSIEIKKIIKN